MTSQPSNNKALNAWLHSQVLPYFKRKGLQLLRDDVNYLSRCLNDMPQNVHKRTVRDYFDVWHVKVARLGQSQNMGRYSANSHLREIVAKRSWEK